ncbi:MAG TPA: hypothetical protein VES67_11600 [Vicinamibacterales bacterium]|nr:hypothetical protein [Vicinamibacterales bacterium]
MGKAGDFSRNRLVGWTSLAVGVAVGLVMGLWSFDGPLRSPAWIGEYTDTSRRLVRLGHIAFIGLGLIDILIERELARSALAPAARAVASWAMVIGNVLLPITLFAAAAYRPLKYFMAVPVTSVFLALVLTAYASAQATEGRQ